MRCYSAKHQQLVDKYLPGKGDGDNKATQAVTALCKLVCMWYNDGDVFDNHYALWGRYNNISGSANWLHTYIPETVEILERIFTLKTEEQYEDLLKDLENVVLKEDLLAELEKQPREGDAYSERGIFSFDDDLYDKDEDY